MAAEGRCYDLTPHQSHTHDLTKPKGWNGFFSVEHPLNPERGCFIVFCACSASELRIILNGPGS